MRTAALAIRPARPSDELAIHELVKGEHLNPIDLDWRRFVVADEATRIVGAAQLRAHADGTRELGSLVVRRDARGRGVAARLIDVLLATAATRVLMITGAAFAGHYARWGFRRIEPARAPLSVRWNYYFGQYVGGALSLLAGRRPKRLAILDALPVALEAADARRHFASVSTPSASASASRLYGFSSSRNSSSFMPAAASA